MECSFSDFINAFLQETDFLTSARKWTPSLLEEVQGIADGADLSLEMALALQLVDEHWNYGRDYQGRIRCSAIGVPRTAVHPAWLAQNMDVEPFRDGFQLLLHIREENGKPEQFIFTSVGLVALNGMNNRSIGVVVNALPQLRSARVGLPVAFIIRGLLEKKTVEDALAFLTDVEHASGQSYLVGAGEKIYCFEASSSQVVRYGSAEGIDVIFHTNHPLINDDYSPSYLSHQASSEVQPGGSEIRFQTLETRLGYNAPTIDATLIRETLASRDSHIAPVCKVLEDGLGSYTFGSMLMTLSDTPYLEVTAGPPNQFPYTRYDFEIDSEGK